MARTKTHYKTLRRSRTVPWGYRVSDYDEDILEPIPELMQLLDVAERAWKAKTTSQDNIAAWLTVKAKAAGFDWPISKMGLRKRLFVTPKNIDRFALKVNAKALQAYTARNRPAKAK